MNKVEKLFMNKGINRAGITMYSQQTDLDFINLCAIHKVIILGIDGYYINNDKTQPGMNNSVNYSCNSRIENIYSKAVEFIESRENDSNPEFLISQQSTSSTSSYDLLF